MMSVLFSRADGPGFKERTVDLTPGSALAALAAAEGHHLISKMHLLMVLAGYCLSLSHDAEPSAAVILAN
jgi:hypothetical protein